MGVFAKNHVVVSGRRAGPTVMSSHGFGCDQNLWRPVAPTPAERFGVALDAVGHCPRLSAPDAAIRGIGDFVTGLR